MFEGGVRKEFKLENKLALHRNNVRMCLSSRGSQGFGDALLRASRAHFLSSFPSEEQIDTNKADIVSLTLLLKRLI